MNSPQLWAKKDNSNVLCPFSGISGFSLGPEVQRESPHGNYLISTVLTGRDRPKETGSINIEVVTMSGKKL